jgi:hypothetical protein
MRAIPVRKIITNVISLSMGLKWALGAEGIVTAASRRGRWSLWRYSKITGKKPQRESREWVYWTVIERCGS